MPDEPEIRFGVGTILEGGQHATAVVVDDRVAKLSDIVARYSTPGMVAPLMRAFLADWDRWHDWLRGLELRPSAEEGWRALDAVKFGPPVPDPWSIFKTYHNYARPSRTTGRLDPPKEERVMPDIFFGSRAALAGYGDIVYREHGGIQFDFEVEVTAVIGKPAYRVPAERGEAYVAGYAITNDLTMHFAWWSELRSKGRGNDSVRMKNFMGYTPMSRVMVPRDRVGDSHDLAVRAWVDGQLRQDTRTNAMLWKIGELVEYLSHIVVLQPGDLIISGSPEELPLPPRAERGILTGQTIVCEVEKLGRLENPVSEQAFRQPKEIDPPPPGSFPHARRPAH